MPLNNGVITAPVDVGRDVAACLGSSSKDVGTLCQDGNINMWSPVKPVPNVTPGVTDAADVEALMKAAGYGFRMADGVSIESFSVEAVAAYSIANNGKWLYQKPRGAAQGEPFRLMDFAGYDHNQPLSHPEPIATEMTVTTQLNVLFTPRTNAPIQITDFPWWVAPVSGDPSNWKYAVVYRPLAGGTVGVVFGQDVDPAAIVPSVVQLPDSLFLDDTLYAIVPVITQLYAGSVDEGRVVYMHQMQASMFLYTKGGTGGYIEDVTINSVTINSAPSVFDGTTSFDLTFNVTYTPWIYGTDHVAIVAKIRNAGGTVGSACNFNMPVYTPGDPVTSTYSDLSVNCPATGGGTPLYLQLTYNGIVLAEYYLMTTPV